MKRFQFTLETVLRWRQDQLRTEELKLERLHLERGAHLKALAGIENSRRQEETAVLASPSVGGTDLVALDAYRTRARASIERVRKALADCAARIEAQQGVLIEARRRCRLLEKLRSRRMEQWRRAFEAELEREASELHLARHASQGRS